MEDLRPLRSVHLTSGFSAPADRIWRPTPTAFRVVLISL